MINAFLPSTAFKSLHQYSEMLVQVLGSRLMDKFEKRGK